MISDSLLIKILYSYLLTKFSFLLLDDMLIEVKKVFYNLISSEQYNRIENMIKKLYKGKITGFSEQYDIID